MRQRIHLQTLRCIGGTCQGLGLSPLNFVESGGHRPKDGEAREGLRGGNGKINIPAAYIYGVA